MREIDITKHCFSAINVFFSLKESDVILTQLSLTLALQCKKIYYQPYIII